MEASPLGGSAMVPTSTRFCHISPTNFIEPLGINKRSHNLLLAHLVFEDQKYADIWKESKSFKILDNSAFEMVARKEPLMAPQKVLEAADEIDANVIVLTDYPGSPPQDTINVALDYGEQFKVRGYGTFFVPQGRPGSVEDLVQSFAWAASSPLIDYIGVSILAVPNAYGCLNANPIQKFICRWKFMNELQARGLLDLCVDNGKKIHFLGMLDGPNEVALCKDFPIHTWDSSAAVWYGANGIRFDGSPTGSFNGKFELPVDFSMALPENDPEYELAIARDNMQYIDGLFGAVNG